jgi:hypothetical protein
MNDSLQILDIGLGVRYDDLMIKPGIMEANGNSVSGRQTGRPLP